MRAIVLVEWVDSVSLTSAWTHPDDVSSVADIGTQLAHRTAGFLLHDDPAFVAIVGSYQISGEGHLNDVLAIPREAVRSFEIVREATA